MTRSFRAATIALPALVGAVLLAGCSGLDDDDPPTPTIAEGTAAAACGSPSTSATVTLSALDTVVTVGSPATDPVNRIDVVGSSSGLDPAAEIVLLLIPDNTDCPSLDSDRVTLAADGSFTGRLDLDEDDDVRIVAIAVTAGATVNCGTTDACIDAAGYHALSNALHVELD
jgi:hypothetical protein